VYRFDKEKPENFLLFSYHTFPSTQSPWLLISGSGNRHQREGRVPLSLVRFCRRKHEKKTPARARFALVKKFELDLWASLTLPETKPLFSRRRRRRLAP